MCLDVSSDDEKTNNSIKNLVIKELQSFKDVRIRDFDNSDLVDPAYMLGLIVIVNPSTNDISIACSFSEGFNLKKLNPYIKILPEKDLDVLLVTSGLSYQHYMNVFVGNTRDLSALSKLIVSDINKTYLEKAREIRKKLR